MRGLAFQFGITAHAILRCAAGRLLRHGNQRRGGIHADRLNPMLDQPTAQPALSTAQIQHTLGRQGENRLDDRRISHQPPAFDALLAHRRRPGIGIGLPAEVELLPVVALHSSLVACSVTAKF